MSATIRRDPRVLAYDDDVGSGHVVTLNFGLAWSDPAARREDDPDGAFACHTRRFNTVREFQRAVGRAYLCACGRCSN